MYLCYSCVLYQLLFALGGAEEWTVCLLTAQVGETLISKAITEELFFCVRKEQECNCVFIN